MIHHTDLGNTGFARLRVLSRLIKMGEISLGGNGILKIYGKLTCPSGKRLKPRNRVFFRNEKEALLHGFRPCGHCIREEYREWKNRTGAR